MSNPTPGATGNPDVDATTLEKRRLLASFQAYGDAQELVDRMSDGGFPVEHLSIVGDGVRTVEHVTGRMTKAKAALAETAGQNSRAGLGWNRGDSRVVNHCATAVPMRYPEPTAGGSDGRHRPRIPRCTTHKRSGNRRKVGK